MLGKKKLADAQGVSDLDQFPSESAEILAEE
jgi:hypothetical protein